MKKIIPTIAISGIVSGLATLLYYKNAQPYNSTVCECIFGGTFIVVFYLTQLFFDTLGKK